MEDRVKQICKQIADLEKVISKMIETSTNKYKDYEEFEKALAPYQRDVRNLERELRMIMPCKSDGVSITKDDCVMTVAKFIEDVKSGCLIDYDGWGYYIKDNKRTNIMVFPSDVKYNAIRKEFDTVIWFNR
jgi:hypothetical protein